MATKTRAKRVAKRKASARRVGAQKPHVPVPILTLKVDGPNVRKGRIPVPDLIKICAEAQNAVTRQAEALEGRRTVHPGPTTAGIRRECTLELVAIGSGSTTLGFDISKPQMLIPFDDLRTLGIDAVSELADTIHSLGNGDKKENLDPGVLRSIYGLGGALDGGVTSLRWIVPKAGAKRPVNSAITKKVRERAAERLSRPTFMAMHIDGILEMADFNRKDRKCRIDPAIGAPVVCSFGAELEDRVYSLMRTSVRATGIGKIPPYSDRVESLSVESIEPLSSLSLGEGNFFASPTINQLAEAQGIGSLIRAQALAGVIPDEELDDFVSTIYSARESKS